MQKIQTWEKPRCEVFKAMFQKVQEGARIPEMKGLETTAGKRTDGAETELGTKINGTKTGGIAQTQNGNGAISTPINQNAATTLFPNQKEFGREIGCGMTRSMGNLCLRCKGKLLCGLKSCPQLERMNYATSLQSANLKKEVFGPSPPSIFVGYVGYPEVNIGPMVSVDDNQDAEMMDNPAKWYGSDFSEIIRFRSALVRGKKKQNVKEKGGMLRDLQELVLSQKNVDVEAKFKKEPKMSMSFSPIAQPMGPSAELESARIAGNVSVPRKVDSLIGENLPAKTAVSELMKNDFDFYYLQKILSAGVLGKTGRKKIVPTRWSITATDSMIANLHIEELKGMKELEEIRIYSNEYLYNHFEILLLPGRWEFEQFECWQAGTLWTENERNWSFSVEYEPFEGRSDYADKEGGGYYAGRFAVTEALAGKIRRQARAVIFREIYEGYKMPVGVWEVRENVRKAFENTPTKCNSLQDAYSILRGRLKNKLESYVSASTVLSQRKLRDY